LFWFPEALSEEFLEECSTWDYFDKGDLVGTGLLMKAVGVSNGCVYGKRVEAFD
jgi:hypothetical protein